MKRVLFYIFCFCAFTNIKAQNLLRGPYQQSATSNSIKILWRTSVPTNGWVKIGNTPDSLTKTFTELDSLKNHIVLITGLNPHTKYYYAVGYDSVTLASGIDHYILTNKEYGDTSGFSFWVIGDAGRANLPQALTRNAFVEHTKNSPVDFMIMLGDNAYTNGTDKEYQEKVFGRQYAYDSILRYLHFYTTPGNHDYNVLRPDSISANDPTIDSGGYFNIVEVPKNGEAGGVPSGTEIYFSHDYGNVHFVSLNSETKAWTTAPGSPLKSWLTEDLEANKLPWTIVYFHQPPFSHGSHNSDDLSEIQMANMRENILPILEEAGVDLVLCGHSHVYERSYLINGFYKRSSFDPSIYGVNMTSGNPDLGEEYVKDSSDRGTVYSVIGNSGSYTLNANFPADLHPVHFFRDAGKEVCGSIIVQVIGSNLSVQYINKYGKVLDKYTIIKSVKSVPTSSKSNHLKSYELFAYPNPSSDVLNVQFHNSTFSKGKLMVTDVSGKGVLTQDVYGEGKQIIPLKGWKYLSAGVYIISLNIGENVESISVVKD